VSPVRVSMRIGSRISVMGKRDTQIILKTYERDIRLGSDREEKFAAKSIY
jgi:hypothetical protein